MAIEGLLGPEVGYVDLLDWSITEKMKSEASKGSTYNPLRPSSAGKCARELAYEYSEYKGLATYDKEPMSPDTHRLLNLGHSIEWNILRMFEDVDLFKVTYRQQVVHMFKLNETDIIKGSIDGCFFSPKHKAVFDIKSKGNKYSGWARTQWDEHDEKFRSLKSMKAITDKAYWIDDLEAFLEEVNDPFLASNFYQVNLYANTEFLKTEGVDHGAVIQYNKNDSRLREIRFRPSVVVYDRIRTKFGTVLSAIDEGRGPEGVSRDYALGSIKCAFCSFRKNCWGKDVDALKEYWATWPAKKWPTRTSRLGAIGVAMEADFTLYQEVENSEKEKDRIEKQIALQMHENKLTKIELENGSVYELKALKGDGLVIRKAKK